VLWDDDEPLAELRAAEDADELCRRLLASPWAWGSSTRHAEARLRARAVETRRFGERPAVSNTLSKLAKTGEVEKAERGYRLTSASWKTDSPTGRRVRRLVSGEPRPITLVRTRATSRGLDLRAKHHLTLA
jgi:hypothetical protein